MFSQISILALKVYPKGLINLRWLINKPRFTEVFAIVWLVTLVALLYLLFWRQITVFDHQQTYTNENASSHLIPLSKFVGEQNTPIQKIQVVHFLDPNCPCYKFAKKYVTQLIKSSTETVSHNVYLKSNDPHWFENDIATTVLTSIQNSLFSTSIASSPATLIIGKEFDNVAYFGPHNDGAVCGQGKGYVPLVINNLQHGFNPEFMNTEAVGCFCKW
jgi:hypothetical protein